MLKISEFIFNAFGEITYLIWDDVTKEAAIVDPGMDCEEEEVALDNFIIKNGLMVKYLVLTHLHIDHVWGVPHIKETYKVPVTAHNDGGYLGSIIDAQAQMFGLRKSPGRIEIENTVDDGDKLTLGSSELEVFHIPGHSPGGIVLYAPKEGFVIAGDVLFRNSIGRTDLPGGNYRQLVDGIKKKLLTLPPETVVYPGHGPETTIGFEKDNNPYIV